MSTQEIVQRYVVAPTELEKKICDLIFAPLIRSSTVFLGTSEKYPNGCEIQVSRKVFQIDEALSAKIKSFKADEKFMRLVDDAYIAVGKRFECWKALDAKGVSKHLAEEQRIAKIIAGMLEIEYREEFFTK